MGTACLRHSFFSFLYFLINAVGLAQLLYDLLTLVLCMPMERLCLISKCRCAGYMPLLLPMVAIFCPRVTRSPFLTNILRLWP